MNEMPTSELLTIVIIVVAIIASASWLLLALPLEIYKNASLRYSTANMLIGLGMFCSLYRDQTDPVVIWIMSDVALFFGLFMYKKAVYKLFNLPNNKMFDQAALAAIAFAVAISILFPVDYLLVGIVTTLAAAATTAMVVYAQYHALVLNIPRYGAAIMVLPTFIVTSVLFTKSLTLWLIPDLALTLFLQPQFDSVPVLWVYLVTFLLINIFGIGSALMLLIFRIQKLADHDQLTGLLNRHAISRELNRAHKLFNRNSTPFSVLLIDVDYFKRVNDNKGHDAGDAAIKHVAKLMLEELRETDHLSRYGGEEFLALLGNCELAKAHKVAEKLRKRIEEEPFLWQSDEVTLTISIGVCCISQVEDLKTLVMNADKALYGAKRSGRNQTLLAQ